MKQRQELLDRAKVEKRVCEKKGIMATGLLGFIKYGKTQKQFYIADTRRNDRSQFCSILPSRNHAPPIKSAIYLWIQTICSSSPSHCTLNSAGWDNDSASPASVSFVQRHLLKENSPALSLHNVLKGIFKTTCKPFVSM